MKNRELFIATASFIAIPVFFWASFIYTHVGMGSTLSVQGLAASTALTSSTTTDGSSGDATDTISNTSETTETITATAETLTTTASNDTPSTTDSSNTQTNTSTGTSSGSYFVDIILPVIKLIGISPLYLKQGSVFIDPGALAYDNRDGDISSRIVRENNVNTGMPGTYRALYRVQDRAGNQARAERIVVVVTPPVTTSTTNTTIDSEPIKTIATYTSTTTTAQTEPQPTSTAQLADTEMRRILDAIRSENIERIGAEKLRILEEARRAAVQEARKATTTAAIRGKIAELQARRASTTPELIQEKTRKIAERNALIERVRADSDRDGISDYDEENIYSTDPKISDSDLDGYSDGSEIIGGYDPLDPDLQGKITYEDPRERGERRGELFAVTAITAARAAANESTKATEKKADRIEFKGKGLPNSFITIYIFSTPIVVTVRTDEEGNWEYVLDQELPDGSHELHVAMTDDTGRILAKGSPIPFVKEAQAITVDPNLLAPFGGTRETSLIWNSSMYVIILTILSVIGIAFVIIGMRARSYEAEHVNEDAGDSAPPQSGNV